MTSGGHLLALINDILDISRIEAGNIDIQLERVDLADTIATVLDGFQNPVQHNSVEIVRNIASDLPCIRADERKLRQVLLNLLSNAFKFTPDGGTVSVSAHWDLQTGMTVEISDTGIGIAAENLNSVLEPFGQVENALSRSHEGTGLGLPLAKALVELHGGALRIDSQLSVGTVVTLTLPASLAVAQPGRTDAPDGSTRRKATAG
jgi:signal transduction histidine kinase